MIVIRKNEQLEHINATMHTLKQNEAQSAWAESCIVTGGTLHCGKLHREQYQVQEWESTTVKRLWHGGL